MRIVSVVGARPQFVKAAMLSKSLAREGIDETLVHTGQHYDLLLSEIFFEELDLPEPDVELGVGSAPHGEQTGGIMTRLERYLMDTGRPSGVVVFGDTNSTLGAALAAAKLQIPVAHVEAGLRSGNRAMPEEINRLLTDHVSTLLFCPTSHAVDNLVREGVTENVHLVGDVMYDALRLFFDRVDAVSDLIHVPDAVPRSYYVATIHRAENTDNAETLAGLLQALGQLDLRVIFPAHPRTRKAMQSLSIPENLDVIDPVGYLTMLSLVRHARGVFTDSGGLQKEAVWLQTPCVTLRNETEWPETTARGWNIVAGNRRPNLAAIAERKPEGPPPTPDPGAPDRIVRILKNVWSDR